MHQIATPTNLPITRLLPLRFDLPFFENASGFKYESEAFVPSTFYPVIQFRKSTREVIEHERYCAAKVTASFDSN